MPNYDMSIFLVKSLKLYIKNDVIKTKVVQHKNKNQLVMDNCLGIETHEISLYKNNSPGSPDKDTPLTGSCYSYYLGQ